MTKNSKFILSPLENIKIQNHGSFNIHNVEFDDGIDLDYKPGFFTQKILIGIGNFLMRFLQHYLRKYRNEIDALINQCSDSGIPAGFPGLNDDFIRAEIASGT